MGGLFSSTALPSLGGGGVKRLKRSKDGKVRSSKRRGSARGSRRKRPSRRRSRYGEDYEDYEDYEDFTEERVMSYAEEYAPPGTMMTDKYTENMGVYMTESYTDWPSNHEPGEIPTGGQSASVTKTGKPTKPPTAGKSPYVDFPNDILDKAMFPAIFENKELQEGGVTPGMSRMRKISRYSNNQPSTPGINLGAAMDLSPMVERTVPDAYPMNFSVILLTILFIVFVMMRK
jgi:hypothetical protein